MQEEEGCRYRSRRAVGTGSGGLWVQEEEGYRYRNRRAVGTGGGGL